MQNLVMACRLGLILCCLHAGLGLAAEVSPKARVALVIGNAKYESAVGALKNPVNDAKAIAKELRGLGFSVTEERNVTRDELLESLSDFRKKVKGSEVALFYFAGHGISVSGSNYLIPIKSGYQPDASDDLTLRMLAETKLFNADQVVAELGAAGGVCNLVILDACRNTPLAGNRQLRSTGQNGGLMEMRPPAGSLVACSTDAGRVAQDGSGVNGLYTGELLKHLRTPGLTIEQVFKRTRSGVMARSDGKQVPVEYSRLVGDDIFMAGPAVTEEPTVVKGDDGVPRAQPVKLPSALAINRLAASGKVDECLDALHLLAAADGHGDYAAAPLDALLEMAKEDLKGVTVASSRTREIMVTCQKVLVAIDACLPPDHGRRAALTAKAQNRRGDCLLLDGKAQEALDSYSVAIQLAPDDAYPLFNRGRAHAALGRIEHAKADYTAAMDPKFKQPMARTLARQAMEKLTAPKAGEGEIGGD